jgi:hypothetical protein
VMRVQQMRGDETGDAPADHGDPHAQARSRTLAGTAWRFRMIPSRASSHSP